MFKNILYNIKEDIYKLRGKSVMASSIAQRLKYSLEDYKENLEATCRYVLSRNPLTMLKSFNKEFKKERDTDNGDNQISE